MTTVLNNPKMAAREIAENTAAGVDIGDAVEATDQDRDTLTYTHSGTGAALFAIDRNTGQLKTKGELDYEDPDNADHLYTVTVMVSDGNGGSDTNHGHHHGHERQAMHRCSTHGESTSRKIDRRHSGRPIGTSRIRSGERW